MKVPGGWESSYASRKRGYVFTSICSEPDRLIGWTHLDTDLVICLGGAQPFSPKPILHSGARDAPDNATDKAQNIHEFDRRPTNGGSYDAVENGWISCWPLYAYDRGSWIVKRTQDELVMKDP